MKRLPLHEDASLVHHCIESLANNHEELGPVLSGTEIYPGTNQARPTEDLELEHAQDGKAPANLLQTCRCQPLPPRRHRLSFQPIEFLQGQTWQVYKD